MDEPKDALLTPRVIAREERFWRPLRLWRSGPRLGVALAALLDATAADGGARQLAALQALFASEE